MQCGPPQILQVVEDDLCIACGACIPACPAKVVLPVYNLMRGAYEVEIRDGGPCLTCEDKPCDAVCPGIHTDFPKLLRLNDRIPPDQSSDVSRFGPVRSVYLGYAPDHRDNGISSSGGIVRRLIESALEQGIPVICLTKGEFRYEPAVLNSPTDLGRVTGSIYHGVGFFEAIELIRSLDRPCYLVSTPCQLAGILKYADICEPGIAGKIALRIGLICGWMYSDHALKAFLSFKGVPEPVLDAQYRGEDKVGRLKITTKNHRINSDRRKFPDTSAALDYGSSFSSAANRLRCRLCQDHLNVLCDIAVGDAWLKRKSQDKLSIIVARTEAGDQILKTLQQEGSMILEQSSEADILESQSEDLVHGITAGKLAALQRPRGTLIPRFQYGTKDRNEEIFPTAAESRELNREMWLRSLLRSGKYRRFRLLYLWHRLDRYHPWLAKALRSPRKFMSIVSGRLRIDR